MISEWVIMVQWLVSDWGPMTSEWVIDVQWLMSEW
jgi:hypothetical protein